MDNYFKRADDLETKSSKYFKPGGNLNENKKGFTNIDDYILSVVSGEKYLSGSEYGTLTGGGRTIVSYESFMNMVDLGYNIVSAKHIGRDMIEVEYQVFDNNKGRMI